MNNCPHLKSCFAYCSNFPKNYVFHNHALVGIWSAQGLLQPSKEDQKWEDIGNRYIKELLLRSFFQDVEYYHSYFTFKMHDLSPFVSQTECAIINCVNLTISGMVGHVSFCYDLDEGEILGVVRRLNDIHTIFSH